ncbi:MAG: hypothetical protein ACXWKP_03895 [Bradyrhizobium sp.]
MPISIDHECGGELRASARYLSLLEEASMAKSKMLILRGNSAGPGSYPDEKGNNNASWPIGALHVQAASSYARLRGYEPVVLDRPGQPQSQHSPQAKAAVKAFLEDEEVAAFFGFSGGGYNLKHILDFLASNKPETLHRIALVVVIGAPMTDGKFAFMPSSYNAIARRRVKHWERADWEVVYRTNPVRSQMPKDLPSHISTHMFGPDILLSGWPEGVGA